jgi:WD40 repeat protein
VLVVASFTRLSHAASPAAEENARLLAQIEPRFKAIFESDEFRTLAFSATWLPDGSGYLKLETPAGASEIAHYDAADGKRTVVVPSEKLIVPGGSKPVRLHWFQRSPSGNRFLFHGETTEGERRGDHWVYETESGTLKPLNDGPGLWFDANAFSPDGQRLLATRGAELVVIDIASGKTHLLTNDGDADAIDNGHNGSWSPDGKWIVYIQRDSSAVPKREMLVPGDPTYRTFREERFERIGGPISTFRIGVVGVEGGPTRWIALADKPDAEKVMQKRCPDAEKVSDTFSSAPERPLAVSSNRTAMKTAQRTSIQRGAVVFDLLIG